VVHHRPASSGEDPADGVVERAAALEALDRLRPDDRELLCLLAWDGLTPVEAATSLGISASTFSVRVHRARRRYDDALAAAPLEDPA
jgi:RNA polymerase sigma-70 factor (ECF subfamily)